MTLDEAKRRVDMAIIAALPNQEDERCSDVVVVRLDQDPANRRWTEGSVSLETLNGFSITMKRLDPMRRQTDSEPLSVELARHLLSTKESEAAPQ